jgi:cell division septation protein DedD
MTSPSIGARIAAVVGGAALITMASFVASCSKDESKTPPPATTTTTVSTTPSSSPSATPTEKVLSPTDGNKFSPSVLAPPAPTQDGGNHHHGLN